LAEVCTLPGALLDALLKLRRTLQRLFWQTSDGNMRHCCWFIAYVTRGVGRGTESCQYCQPTSWK